jgi:hypothetical protein
VENVDDLLDVDIMSDAELTKEIGMEPHEVFVFRGGPVQRAHEKVHPPHAARSQASPSATLPLSSLCLPLCPSCAHHF